jgi:hypothetical protein
MSKNGVHRLTDDMKKVGLSEQVVRDAVFYLYDTLTAIDGALMARGEPRLAQIVELANLSSMIGNLFRSGISKHSNKLFANNGPHKYPDLLHSQNPDYNVEIKMALEDNNPKGHLAKEGWHLTCHYVLCDEQESFKPGKENRGCVPRVWLVRFGYLKLEHFNISNTAGDSGKTAVVNKDGLMALKPVFYDAGLSPLSAKGSKSKSIAEHFATGT